MLKKSPNGLLKIEILRIKLANSHATSTSFKFNVIRNHFFDFVRIKHPFDFNCTATFIIYMQSDCTLIKDFVKESLFNCDIKNTEQVKFFINGVEKANGTEKLNPLVWLFDDQQPHPRYLAGECCYI